MIRCHAAMTWCTLIFFQADDGIRDTSVTGVQTCALPISDGGDVVMLDPGTGEVLALASRHRDGNARPSAFTDTFEPGSIVKIFAAAALLSRDRVAPTDRVSGEGGRWLMPGRRRPLTDEDPQPTLTLADAIRVSSNIAMAKFVTRLAPAEQYLT